jgi:hypothetical protein
VAHTVLRFVLALVLTGGTVAAFEPSLDLRLIDEAIAVGQSRIEAVRERYHQPYRLQVNQPPIDYIEVVTPFRRVVLLAEERARAAIAGSASAMRSRPSGSPTPVEIIVEMTFHPPTFIES